MGDAMIIMVCPDCKSTDIVGQAIITWSIKQQAWVLEENFKDYACRDCDAEFSKPLDLNESDVDEGAA